MDLIIAAPDLQLIRRRLASLLPQRPSLLAEAIASGLGHRTHAAALAAVAALPPPRRHRRGLRDRFLRSHGVRGPSRTGCGG